jgi:hypothetical protein
MYRIDRENTQRYRDRQSVTDDVIHVVFSMNQLEHRLSPRTALLRVIGIIQLEILHTMSAHSYYDEVLENRLECHLPEWRGRSMLD